MGGACSTNRSDEKFVENIGQKTSREETTRPGCRWEDNIRKYFREIGWEDVDFLGLSQGRGYWRSLLNMVTNLRVP
jgi:hypothetical protein